MTKKQADTLERIERFGISRTAWRLSVMAAFAMLAFLGAFLSLTKGSADISLAQIINILSNPTLEPQSQIIWNIRMPRTIVGALVGVNLAIAGAVLRAVMRNPLADRILLVFPVVLVLAGVTIMILFPTLEYLITPAAFIGAMLAAVCIYILAWKNGIKPVRIILAGVAVSAFLSAGISGLMIFYSDRVHGALMWMVGGLAARSWPHVSIILPYAIVGVLLAFIGAAYLNILQLGDEMARGLGVNVEVTRIAMTAVAALLAASAVSVVGLLGFVGLIVPHAARLIIGSDYRYLMPASGLLGIAVVTLSDTFARVVFAPVELPVGIIMAFIGAPFISLRRKSDEYLQANEITIRIIDKTIIHGLSLSVPEGKVTSIIGPNGCGKSTTLKALARIWPCYKGNVTFNGEDIKSSVTGNLLKTGNFDSGSAVSGRFDSQRFSRDGPLSTETGLAAKVWKMMHMRVGVRANEYAGDAASSAKHTFWRERQRAWIAMAWRSVRKCFYLMNLPLIWIFVISWR
ncbi:MAG: iron chelate uptake ABC transporter family permease subunit [Phascolarctobacterium faecium]